MAFVQKLIVVTAVAWLTTGCADLAQQDSSPVAVVSTHDMNNAPALESAPEDAHRRVGRYTTALATPVDEASDPLGVYARIAYPRQTVRTVGEAIEHTLLRTGWRLENRSSFESAAAHYMTLPLPESQRVLGPYPVRTILRILADGSWQWHEDPVRRVTWFTLANVAPAVVQPATSAVNGSPAAMDNQATPTAVSESEVRSTPLPSVSVRNEPTETATAVQETSPTASGLPDCECD